MTPNGIHYLLGRACWHVIGYRPNGAGTLLCGQPIDVYAVTGTSVDVTRSDMPVCRTCDRATGGQAAHLDGAAS